MRVFVTGASGFVGSAVVRELLSHGHQVLGFARSDATAETLAATGAEVLRGDLNDLDSLKKGAADTDGTIHTGFVHDFAKFKESCEIDERAIKAMGETLAGSGRPLIVTSGTGLLRGDPVVTEDIAAPANAGIPRVSEQTALAFIPHGVRASVIRLPPSTHGEGDHGFVPILIDMARQKGEAAYIGDGNNVWPAVHRLDAAKLYRLVLEKGTQPRYHAIADQGVPFREIAEVIGRRLGVPVTSKSPEEAAAYFNWFSHFAQMDSLSSSEKTQAELGWKPTMPRLIEDLDQDYYFRG